MAATTTLPLKTSLSLSILNLLSSNKLPSSLKPIKFQSCTSPSLFSQTYTLSSLPGNNLNKRGFCFLLCSTVQETPQETETDETQEGNLKRKLFVLNLPWSFTVADIKELFGQCGNVSDVEIIKQNNGKSRGFAFVTMGSGEEAQTAVEKLDSHQVSGRIIRVEFAKRFKKPSPPPPPGTPTRNETRHKLYVSNLAWKVRSTHLREFFTASFKPVSSRVIFDSPSGRSAGYGFVSFETKEEAEAALSSLDGKELMGRPLRLKFSENKADEGGNATQKAENSENQPDE